MPALCAGCRAYGKFPISEAIQNTTKDAGTIMEDSVIFSALVNDRRSSASAAQQRSARTVPCRAARNNFLPQRKARGAHSSAPK